MTVPPMRGKKQARYPGPLHPVLAKDEMCCFLFVCGCEQQSFTNMPVSPPSPTGMVLMRLTFEWLDVVLLRSKTVKRERRGVNVCLLVNGSFTSLFACCHPEVPGDVIDAQKRCPL